MNIKVSLKKWLKKSIEKQIDDLVVLNVLRAEGKFIDYNIQRFEQIEYGKVKKLHAMYESEDIDILNIIEIITGYSKTTIYKQSIGDIFKFINFVNKGIERTIKAEQKLLTYNSDKDEVAAGIDKFNKFGNYGTVRSIAIQLRVTLDWVEKQPYENIFLELMYQKEESEFQKRLINIKYKS
jgi:hypothetical protein